MRMSIIVAPQSRQRPLAVIDVSTYVQVAADLNGSIVC